MPEIYKAIFHYTETCNECLNGSIQLTGGSTPYDGRLEVCTAGCWTSVCISEYSWSTQDAAVACKQLQLSSNGKAINSCWRQKLFMCIYNEEEIHPQFFFN